jgi:hypothetical protein
MQTTILTCDFCKAARRGVVFAVGTLTLVNGRPKRSSPKLDLCKRHVREVERYFTAASHTVPRAEAKKPKVKQSPGLRAARWEPLWQAAEKKVLLALQGQGEGLKGPELSRRAKVSKHMVYKVTARLLAAGKIKRAAEGGRQGFKLPNLTTSKD